MDLQYSDEQLMPRDGAQRFLAEKYVFDERRRQHVSDGCDRKMWHAFAELGWLALPFAEENGGLGAGAIEVAVLMEAFGRALVSEPYIPALILATAPYSDALLIT